MIQSFKGTGSFEKNFTTGYGFANDPVILNDWIPGE
jgi:hypothetical protein